MSAKRTLNNEDMRVYFWIDIRIEIKKSVIGNIQANNENSHYLNFNIYTLTITDSDLYFPVKPCTPTWNTFV